MQDGYAICFNEWALDKDIKDELGLLIIISSLSAEKGFCFASNSYLAKLFNINEVTVSRKLGILENKKYITIEYERCGARVTGRKIRLTKMLTDDYQKCKSAVNKNVKDNNTSINNTSINNIYSMNKKTNNKCSQTAPKNAKFENSREYTKEEYDSFCDV